MMKMRTVSERVKKEKGFTVVELIVSVGLFLAIISVAIGAYVKILRTQSLMTKLMAANDNVSLILEQIAREIRTADDFPAAGRYNSLTFRSAQGECVKYSWIRNRKEITRAAVSSIRPCATVGYGQGEVLSSENVLINNMVFQVSQDVNLERSIIFDRVEISVEVNTEDQFFDEGNEIKTVVSARKYFKNF